MASSQGRGMAASLVVLALVLLCNAGGLHAGTTYQVGDGADWSLSELNYNYWASNKAFHVNDILVFKYSSEMHNVVQVDREHYMACSSSNPIQEFSNGDTTVQLTQPGVFYYICGVADHCQAGMKMQVIVH